MQDHTNNNSQQDNKAAVNQAGTAAAQDKSQSLSGVQGKPDLAAGSAAGTSGSKKDTQGSQQTAAAKDSTAADSRTAGSSATSASASADSGARAGTQQAQAQAAYSASSESKASAAPAHRALPEQQVIVKNGSSPLLSVLSVVLLLAVAGTAFYSYHNVSLLQSEQSKMQDMTAQLTEVRTELAAKNSNLEQVLIANSQLTADNQALKSQIAQVQTYLQQQNSLQQQGNEAVSKLNARLDRFEARDPDEWRIAESYFNVSEAYRLCLFGQDAKGALWNLRQADTLLTGIETAETVALRAAITKDITTLSAVPEVDRTGIALKLEQIYRDSGELVLSGFLDEKARAAAFAKDNEPTANVADWSDNLIKSGKEFLSRFIDIRRRNGQGVQEFLSPGQDMYLRQNIATRVLLARADLQQGNEESYKANLEEVKRLVSTYFEAENGLTKATLEQLDELMAVDVGMNLPRSLESYALFKKMAQAHLDSLSK